MNKILYYNYEGNTCRFIYINEYGVHCLAVAENMYGLKDFLTLSNAEWIEDIHAKQRELSAPKHQGE